MRVSVVTDSTADLPPGIARDLGITVVPAQIQFGREVFLDGVDLSNEEFYRRLQSNRVLPKTSPPSIGTFSEVYRRLSEEADAIISIHVAANLSVTYDSARTASAGISCPVSVVDSETASMACGLLAILAAKVSREGLALKEVEAMVRQAIPNTITFGVFGTLEYLARGGRIGRAQAFLGGVLKIHPILAIRAGEVVPIERVRTRTRAIDRLCEIVRALGIPREAAVLSTTDPAEAEGLAQRLSFLFPQDRMYRAKIGPAMGTQVGPHAVGAAFIMERPVRDKDLMTGG
jgi:DegV family protein with EDD domain